MRIKKYPTNQYSHQNAIPFDDSVVGNLLAEGENITSHVLKIMRKADSVHFGELMEVYMS